MSGKHDKTPDDEQSANLLLTGPIVIRGLGRSVKDALLPGRPSRHRAFAGEAVPAAGAVDPTPVGLMLAGGPVVTESGPSTDLSEREDTQNADSEHAFPQDVAVTRIEVADGPGEDRVDDRRDDEPSADADVEQPRGQETDSAAPDDGATPHAEADSEDDLQVSSKVEEPIPEPPSKDVPEPPSDDLVPLEEPQARVPSDERSSATDVDDEPDENGIEFQDDAAADAIESQGGESSPVDSEPDAMEPSASDDDQVWMDDPAPVGDLDPHDVETESPPSDPVEPAEERSTQRTWTTAEELFSSPPPTGLRADTAPPAEPAESIDDFAVAADDTASAEEGAGSEQPERRARAQQESAVIPPAAAAVTAAPRSPKPSGSGGTGRPPRHPRPARERFGREAVGIAVLVVLALICGGLITAVVLKTQRDSAIAAQEAADYTPPPLATPEPTSTGPVVAVIGDGTTSAAASGVTSAERWSTVLAKSLDGTVDTDASGGMGYAAKGSSGGTFVTAAAKIPSNADVVVFFGGAADSNVSTLSLAKAATDAFSTASEQAPDAKVIVVGPAVADGVSIADLTTLRNTLRSSAGIAKATWIDPIDKDWLSTAKQAGKPTALTVADEKTLAAKMETAVKAALK